jgi:hygromycin-B 7''-O-kinase
LPERSFSVARQLKTLAQGVRPADSIQPDQRAPHGFQHCAKLATVKQLFPEVSTPEGYERIARDEAELRPGINKIRDLLGLSGSLSRFASGSLPVYAVGDHLVLKLYPPPYFDERKRESAVLELLDGRLPIPTPGVRGVGSFEGWGYVLMDRLRGEDLTQAWPRLSDQERSGLATKLGEALKALHSIRDPALQTIAGDWQLFVEDQQRSAVDRQRCRGVEASFIEQIPAFLEANAVGGEVAECLLHTEVMREHLFVEHSPEGVRLSGLFDFEPSMIGVPEHEFASVGLFFSCGNPELLRRVLLAYGYRESDLNAALERRLLAHALLHRYSDLARYLRQLPPPKGTATLEALAAYWWGVEKGSVQPKV